MQPLPQQPKIDFLDISNSQLIPRPPPQSNQSSSQSFLNEAEKFWLQKGYKIDYQRGLFFGRGDYSHLPFSEFIKKFRKMFEDIIREELKAKGDTSEEFKNDFKTLEFLYLMIFNHLQTKNIEIKNEKYLALLHGLINAHVDSILSIDSNV
jgi:hypothetical protein